MWYMVECYWDPSNIDQYGPISDLMRKINKGKSGFKEQHWNIGSWTICVLDDLQDAQSLARILGQLCHDSLEYRAMEYSDLDHPQHQHWQDAGSLHSHDNELTPDFKQQQAVWQHAVFSPATAISTHRHDRARLWTE
jgi:hypothetical protein